MRDLIVLTVTAVALNILMFIPAYIKKTDKLTDISYALTFAVLILFSLLFSTQMWEHIILALLIIWWAARLGGFLYVRLQSKGKDSRFDEIREKPLIFLRFWVLQGISAGIVLMPALLFMQVVVPRVTSISIIGFIIFAVGLYIEAEADLQKWRFSLEKENKSKWVETGWWAKSRHPNYFGEILVWIGIYLYTFQSLSGLNWLLALLSPVYITVILLFVSGIPPLEKAANKKWGKDKAYQTYKKNVPVLIPKLNK